MPFKNPDRLRAYHREYQRQYRAGDVKPCVNPALPAAFRLQTAQDVIDLLQEQVEAVRSEAEAGTLEKARAIGFLAGIALKAIEAGDVAARLEALESVLATRAARSA
jgi:hypothetical protein